jgi:hypothetical protein
MNKEEQKVKANWFGERAFMRITSLKLNEMVCQPLKAPTVSQIENNQSFGEFNARHRFLTLRYGDFTYLKEPGKM